MMLTLRIRKAEVAMADGRLDDAYQQAIREDVQDHRRGQHLISKLSDAFRRRGQQHLQSGNASAALADADRAARLGGNQPELLSLRDEALAAVESRHQQRNARHRTIDAARRCIASGDYSLGAELCDRLDHGKTVVGLMQDAELNRRLMEAAIKRGESALQQSQYETALEALEEAKRHQSNHEDVVHLQDRVGAAVCEQVRKAIAAGRLDRAAGLVLRMGQVVPNRLDLAELNTVIEQCRLAAISARAADVTPAVDNLKSLKVLVPDARWLDDAIAEAETVARSMERLRTGPLGLLNSSVLSNNEHISRTTVMRASDKPSHRATPAAVVPGLGGVLPNRFMIHVDGAGSFLVIRGPRTTVGTPSRSRHADVEVLGRLDCSQLIIERMDEDYFATSEKPIVLNGKKVVNSLLSNGDELRIGRRASVKFTQPCSASTSAVLDFRGMRLAHGNARRVLLMDDSLVLGPQPNAHVQVPALERSMVIHSRGDQLHLRPLSPTTEGIGVPLALGRPNDLDGLSLVVAEVA